MYPWHRAKYSRQRREKEGGRGMSRSMSTTKAIVRHLLNSSRLSLSLSLTHPGAPVRTEHTGPPRAYQCKTLPVNFIARRTSSYTLARTEPPNLCARQLTGPPSTPFVCLHARARTSLRRTGCKTNMCRSPGFAFHRDVSSRLQSFRRSSDLPHGQDHAFSCLESLIFQFLNLPAARRTLTVKFLRNGTFVQLEAPIFRELHRAISASTRRCNLNRCNFLALSFHELSKMTIKT